MTDDSLMTRARGLWEQLAAVPVSFPPHGGVAITVSAVCPPSWAGIVRLGDAAIVTVSDEERARLLRQVMADMTVDSSVQADVLRSMLPVAEVLGPAALGYLSTDDFRPASGTEAVAFLPPGHGDLRALAESSGRDDVDESGIDEIDSPVFVVRDGSGVLAAAGYRTWSASAAHLCVLTAPQQRGRGLAQQVASKAVAHALDADLLPQWRARPKASRRVAAALGLP